MTRLPIPILLSLVGCVTADGDEPPVAATEQSLSGAWAPAYPSCDARYNDMITDAVHIATSTVFDTDFRDCLKNSLLSYTWSFPEEIVDQLQLNTTTYIGCKTVENADAEAQEGLGELVYLDPEFLARPTTNAASVAALIAHEILHNRGYQHPNPESSSSELGYAAALEYSYTANEQAKFCSAYASGAIPSHGYGPGRSSLAQETTLAPTGWASGSDGFSKSCPAGKIAAGISGYMHTYVDAVGLKCRDASGTGTWSFSGQGGSPTHGGDPHELECPSGEIMIGAWGRAASYNDRIGPVCASATAIAAGQNPIGHVPAWAGGDGGLPYVRRCPTGMAVRAISGKFGDFVDRIELECQNVNHLEPVIEHKLAYVGGTHPDTRKYETCAGRAALTSLTMQTGSKVDRLGGKCSPIQGSLTIDTVTPRYMLPAWGGTGGNVHESDCPAGEVIVGANVWYDADGINGIVAVCAPPAQWVNGGGMRYLPIRGTWNGTKATPTCAKGEFLVGWKIATGTFVDGFEPICRLF